MQWNEGWYNTGNTQSIWTQGFLNVYVFHKVNVVMIQEYKMLPA